MYTKAIFIWITYLTIIGIPIKKIMDKFVFYLLNSNVFLKYIYKCNIHSLSIICDFTKSEIILIFVAGLNISSQEIW